MNISAQMVKELRDKTGAGMMDCKKVLEASQGDFDQAMEMLRQKGLASATKKSQRVAAEGIIESYIHTGAKIGVLLELNCETDFVARRREFQNLSRDIAMQIVASPNVEYISAEDIPEELITEEKRIEAGKEDLQNKPDNVRDKIVTGRVEKRLKELSLLDQSFIKQPDITIEELIKKHIALLGENIQLRRFEKFIVGGGIEKRSSNFADEVAEILDHKA
uniref:elongation factor Ts n=1 Tax=Tsunamia transpacifica TaxID=1935457 RepID=UPI001BEDF0E2|nr:elongation factor Ts [Tsunamia transpacifica]QUE27930.1 tsf [Tsunamia transpacifica]UNJ14445.1 elongation factor Ts [Tsunamia transpacifica]